MLNCCLPLSLTLGLPLPPSPSLSFSVPPHLCVSVKQQAKQKRRETHLKYPVRGGKTQKTLEAIRIQQLTTDTKIQIQRYNYRLYVACNLWQLLLLLLEGIDIYRQLMALIIAQCRSIMDF